MRTFPASFPDTIWFFSDYFLFFSQGSCQFWEQSVDENLPCILSPYYLIFFDYFWSRDFVFIIILRFCVWFIFVYFLIVSLSMWKCFVLWVESWFVFFLSFIYFSLSLFCVGVVFVKHIYEANVIHCAGTLGAHHFTRHGNPGGHLLQDYTLLGHVQTVCVAECAIDTQSWANSIHASMSKSYWLAITILLIYRNIFV